MKIGFAGKQILSYLGFDTTEKLASDTLDMMLKRFGEIFPGTEVFSEYARTTLEISDNADEAIIQCVSREEALFRKLEKYLVEKELENGIDDIDQFERFAKSWINRRYSRAGHCFENHLAFLFQRTDLLFSRQKVTENRKKPDYIFPHVNAYHKLDDKDVNRLVTILGAKRTCKDRWRQVIREANKVDQKYLVTLEPGISVHQTEEMKAEKVQLIVPDEIQESYGNSAQKKWLMNLTGFIDHVKTIQNKHWASGEKTMDDILKTLIN